MRAGMSFVRNTPAMRAAMLRAFVYSIPAAAPWALLPLVVREQLHLGAAMYGVILGLMGVGGVSSGMLLPRLRGHFSQSAIVLGASMCSCAGVAVLGLSRHWLPASAGMLLFGLGWVAAYSTLQAAAQLSAPPWVRARSLAIYQLAQNGALTLGSFGWGWLGDMLGLSTSLVLAAVVGAGLAIAVRGFWLDHLALTVPRDAVTSPEPEAPATELLHILSNAHGRVMEMRALPGAGRGARGLPRGDGGCSPGARRPAGRCSGSSTRTSHTPRDGWRSGRCRTGRITCANSRGCPLMIARCWPAWRCFGGTARRPCRRATWRSIRRTGCARSPAGYTAPLRM